MDRHGTGKSTVIGLSVQVLLEVTIFGEFILLSYNSGRSDRIIYLWKTANAFLDYIQFIDMMGHISRKQLEQDRGVKQNWAGPWE